MLSVVKMSLKGEVGGPAFNSHGNYFVDHVKSWKNHGIVFLNFCGNPVQCDDMLLKESECLHKDIKHTAYWPSGNFRQYKWKFLSLLCV